jgi:hypothetical protein
MKQLKPSELIVHVLNLTVLVRTNVFILINQLRAIEQLNFIYFYSNFRATLWNKQNKQSQQ